MNKVLIIGNDPKYTSGVTNYTRPLSNYLSKNNQVYYLFNDAFDTIPRRKIKVDKFIINNICHYKVTGGPANLYNYHNLNLDTGIWFDSFFNDILNDCQPDIIHINEIFGFSSRIILLAKQKNIKVFATVHEYWWLCPHRVMVDFNKRICEGPSNLEKCTHCILSRKANTPGELIKYKNNIQKKYPRLFKATKSILSHLGLVKKPNDNYEFTNSLIKEFNPKLKIEIQDRLLNNVRFLNMCDNVIAVSSDVRKILISYNVNPDIILINHIGSLSAEEPITHIKQINKNSIVFGFIGGVGYYKGVHQLIEAWTLLSDIQKSKCQILIYGKCDTSYLTYMKSIIDSFKYKENICFFGAYERTDLERITNTIDICVLPSLCADTAPQTIFESFSAGLPIIAPNVGGYPDFIHNGVNGILYEKESVDDLFKKISSVIDDPLIIKKLSQNIIPQKTLSKHLEELQEIYNN